MFHVAISQLTTSRWELPEEIARLADNGFDCLSLWRAKLSDLGHAAAASLLTEAGMSVSSLQWAGGFTGGDGRTFAESIADAAEAIEAAAILGAPVLLVHSGCRGGHTRAHARRLLVQALETLAPLAGRAGVTLAVKPVHAAAAPGCSFLTRAIDALELVAEVADPAVRMALDLWQFGDDEELPRLLPQLAAATAVVQVADRVGPPTAELERLPVGHGGLPLESLILSLIDHGYSGAFEFDPVGEAVASLGYDRVLAETRQIVDAWTAVMEQRLLWNRAASAVWQTAGLRTAAASDGGLDQPLWQTVWPRLTGDSTGGSQLRSAGSRRSHPSSQTVSPG
jgi:sugar phosphate isomerase/epimerase